MSRITFSILVTFVACAYAQKLLMTFRDGTSNSVHKLADKRMTEALHDKLFKQRFKPLFSHHADLDKATLGKLGHLTVPCASCGFRPPQLRPALFQNSQFRSPPPERPSALKGIGESGLVVRSIIEGDTVFEPVFSSKKYYFDPLTGESSWESPETSQDSGNDWSLEYDDGGTTLVLYRFDKRQPVNSNSLDRNLDEQSAWGSRPAGALFDNPEEALQKGAIAFQSHEYIDQSDAYTTLLDPTAVAVSVVEEGADGSLTWEFRQPESPREPWNSSWQWFRDVCWEMHINGKGRLYRRACVSTSATESYYAMQEFMYRIKIPNVYEGRGSDIEIRWNDGTDDKFQSLEEFLKEFLLYKTQSKKVIDVMLKPNAGQQVSNSGNHPYLFTKSDDQRWHLVAVKNIADHGIEVTLVAPCPAIWVEGYRRLGQGIGTKFTPTGWTNGVA